MKSLSVSSILSLLLGFLGGCISQGVLQPAVAQDKPKDGGSVSEVVRTRRLEIIDTSDRLLGVIECKESENVYGICLTVGGVDKAQPDVIDRLDLSHFITIEEGAVKRTASFLGITGETTRSGMSLSGQRLVMSGPPNGNIDDDNVQRLSLSAAHLNFQGIDGCEIHLEHGGAAKDGKVYAGLEIKGDRIPRINLSSDNYSDEGACLQFHVDGKQTHRFPEKK